MLKRAVALLALATIAAAQDQRTPEPYFGGTFEIVSLSFPYSTYKLNRFTGQIFQMVGNSRDKYHWKEMEVVGLPKDDLTEPRYQMVLLDSYSFLLDTATGKTWILVSDSRGTRWQPLPPEERLY